jgi:hypothetical protein
MATLGFFIIVSSPIWMVFVCVHAYAHRTEAAKRLWWAAVIILVAGWAIYGLPTTDGELFLAAPATFISILLAAWARYVVNTEPSDEDAVLYAAEAVAHLEGAPERSRGKE